VSAAVLDGAPASRETCLVAELLQPRFGLRPLRWWPLRQRRGRRHSSGRMLPFGWSGGGSALLLLTTAVHLAEAKAVPADPHLLVASFNGTRPLQALPLI
jgi:hypothetical protein